MPTFATHTITPVGPGQYQFDVNATITWDCSYGGVPACYVCYFATTWEGTETGWTNPTSSAILSTGVAACNSTGNTSSVHVGSGPLAGGTAFLTRLSVVGANPNTGCGAGPYAVYTDVIYTTP